MKTPDLPSSAMHTPLRLVASNVHHVYGSTPVLHDVCIAVEPREILCLVGPSGCGKSTLLRLFAGLERLQAGAIHIDGQLVASAARHVEPEKRNIGLVFQDFALFPHMSLLENVAFGVRMASRREAEQHARHVLARVDMGARASDFPHVLSGGQQQRVALARAIASQPRMILLDEPFSSLDVRLRHRMRVETLKLLKETDAACIFVTHDPEEAMYMADRIALMHAGRVVQIGSPAELYRRPVSAFAAQFFGEMNTVAAVVERQQVHLPFGVFAASGLEDGAQVDVLVRPESIQLAPAGAEAFSASVTSCRMLGGVSMLGVRVYGGAGDGLELLAQVPSSTTWRDGENLRLRVDPGGVFVFASSA